MNDEIFVGNVPLASEHDRDCSSCPRCAEETLGAVGLCRKCQVEYAVCAPLKPQWIDRVWRWCWEHLR